MRIFRVAIPASDIQRSRRFYERVLGLDADDTIPTRIYFHCGDVILTIVDWSIGERPALQPTSDNVYFSTDDVDAAFDRAVDAGAEILAPIETQSWGERSFYCRDPDGNRLCFVDSTTLFLGRGAAWS